MMLDSTAEPAIRPTASLAKLEQEIQIMRRCAALMVTWLFVSGACAEAQQRRRLHLLSSAQLRDDAWWTGPMLAPPPRRYRADTS